VAKRNPHGEMREILVCGRNTSYKACWSSHPPPKPLDEILSDDKKWMSCSHTPNMDLKALDRWLWSAVWSRLRDWALRVQLRRRRSGNSRIRTLGFRPSMKMRQGLRGRMRTRSWKIQKNNGGLFLRWTLQLPAKSKGLPTSQLLAMFVKKVRKVFTRFRRLDQHCPRPPNSPATPRKSRYPAPDPPGLNYHLPGNF